MNELGTACVNLGATSTWPQGDACLVGGGLYALISWQVGGYLIQMESLAADAQTPRDLDILVLLLLRPENPGAPQSPLALLQPPVKSLFRYSKISLAFIMPEYIVLKCL
ncbi:hypothetical protein ElyMa_005170300 [Elysia marginata]|uniref:Uncharacterized protein n=1 Tax=Elysia marginata TaxID=1093978 RepID=A0AAV4JS74_9GAST|nr:hypothetical protein ElyMa_005170300 [Elysia marginata]